MRKRFFGKMHMRGNFNHHAMWHNAAAAAATKGGEVEAEPATTDAAVAKNAKIAKELKEHDSDNDTASASSGDTQSSSGKDSAAPTLLAASFARAGRLLWSRPLSGLAGFTKQHSRTVSDFSESDFSPFAPGTPVWTKYGLGTITAATRDDGFTVVNLQGQSPMTLYLHSSDEDYYAVPAIRHDWVETPAGEGRVLRFDPKTQQYAVRLGGDGDGSETSVHRVDVRRSMPVRRQPTPAPTPVPTTAPGTAPATAPAAPASAQESVLAKGFTSAFKSIVSTSYIVSNYYYQGQCVVTSYGSGHIASLDQTNQRAQVQLTWGATAFMHTDAILYYPKALEGMEVSTKFGNGIVTELRPADGMYTVKLQSAKEGENEVVFVHESDLARGRRLRLGSAPKQVKQVKEKLASTSKLFSFAPRKLFGQSSSGGSPGSATKLASTKDAAPAPLENPSSTASSSSRSKSTRVLESDDEEEKDEERKETVAADEEPSSAGI